MESTVQNEEALWSGIIAGDRHSFRMLYEAYADTLYAYALRYTPDREIIKDCIHDLFVDLYTYHHRLTPQVNVKFYLLVSFRRKLNTHLKASSQLSLREDMSAFDLTFDPDNIQSRIIAGEEQHATRQLLAAEMNKLPARQKEILYLKFNCGLEYEEIAALMNITIPTCRTLAYRAIRQLRKELSALPVPGLGLLLFYLAAR